MFSRRSSKTYVPTTVVLLLPKQAVALMQQGLAEYRLARVEGCCFWYGPKTDSEKIFVTHVVFPKQVNNQRHFSVPSEAVAEMSDATRPLGIVNRAQIHTHPGSWVGHSPYDDEHAISRKALSIVFPWYGSAIKAWPRAVGVHEFQNDIWHRLRAQQKLRRIQLVDGEINLVDLR